MSELALLEPRLGAPGADGGGQLALGRAATILAVITLRALRSLDVRIPREQRAIIVVSTSDKSPLSPIEVSRLAGQAGYRARVVRLERGRKANGLRLRSRSAGAKSRRTGFR